MCMYCTAYMNGYRNLLCENKIKLHLLLQYISQLLKKCGSMFTSH